VKVSLATDSLASASQSFAAADFSATVIEAALTRTVIESAPPDRRGSPSHRGRYAAQWVKRQGRWLIRSEVFVALTCSGIGCSYTAVP
jgi:hypothetical protein